MTRDPDFVTIACDPAGPDPPDVDVCPCVDEPIEWVSNRMSLSPWKHRRGKRNGEGRLGWRQQAPAAPAHLVGSGETGKGEVGGPFPRFAQCPGPRLWNDLGTQDRWAASGDRLLAQMPPLSQWAVTWTTVAKVGTAPMSLIRDTEQQNSRAVLWVQVSPSGLPSCLWGISGWRHRQLPST